MSQSKTEAMFQDPDDLDFCEDCGKAGSIVIQMGRRWCLPCWEAFEREYNSWLDSTKEVTSGK